MHRIEKLRTFYFGYVINLLNPLGDIVFLICFGSPITLVLSTHLCYDPESHLWCYIYPEY